MTTVSPTAQQNRSLEFRSTLGRLASTTIFSILLITGILYVVMPIFTFRWINTPFVGAFTDPTLTISGVYPTYIKWDLLSQGVRHPDRIVAINDQPITSANSLQEILSQFKVNDTVNVIVEKGETVNQSGWVSKGKETHKVVLAPFPFESQLYEFLTPYLVGFIFFITGCIVFYIRRRELSGRIFGLFCAMMAIMIGGLFDFYSTHLFTILWTISVPMVGGSLISLSFVFPQEARSVERYPIITWLPYIPALAWSIVLQSLITDYAHPRMYLQYMVYSYLYSAVGAVAFIITNIYRWITSASPLVKNQSRIISFSTIIATAPTITWVIFTALESVGTPHLEFNNIVFFGFTIFIPIGVGYAILRYRLLNTHFVLTKTLTYTILFAFITIGYGLVVTGISVYLGTAPVFNSPLTIAAITFFLVLALNPLRRWIEKRIDNLFSISRLASNEDLQKFSRTLTSSVELSVVANEIRQLITSTLKPAHLFLFLHSGENAEYSAYPFDSHAPTDIRFGTESALARTLAVERNVVYLAPDAPLPLSLVRERGRLAVLNIAVFIPLHSKNELIGWLALGNKLSGQPYTTQDLNFLELLTDQSALAIERGQAIGLLEKRLNELNVLSQVSQAVNFSIAFDDLLELIYAQAGRVLEVSNFSIVLYQSRTQVLSNAFYIENNERNIKMEKETWTLGQGLVSEIIRTGQPILTDDYLEECARRRVPPLTRPYLGWMGVPLNGGAGTLGAMIISSFDPARNFTDDELKIFSAIADQAATAIDKSRLYQQTAQRAKQLATLNQVAQTITSTLDLEPLLQQILGSAVNILTCEAGSLFLIDAETGESIFKNTVGPVASNLIGTRIPAGRGIVGEAATSGQPMIVNDTTRDQRFFQQADRTTGFLSRSVLAVPLRIKDRTIGVIEVINKRDTSPFDDEDVALLTAFGGQAAVAIENARLFNSTDQALTARVEELSVMQRIDRELNAALDVKRIFGFVLDRALETTGADAAVAGIMLEDGLNLVAHRGYGDAIKPYLENIKSFNKNLIGQALENRRVLLIKDVKADPDYIEILPATTTQLTIPMRREDQTIGILILEAHNVECFVDDKVEFIVRLADHAAIAIANARLYSEVNAANLAKSEFVSFVSHELKTPMTSIKGYTEWLSGGAVGPLNETQQQFLSIIKSNIERMTTIVSDLADVARIESGRLKLETKEMSFQLVIDEVVTSLQGQYDAKQQTLVLNVESDLPKVWGDYVRLTQALTNLMSNGYKYTPTGGTITLHVSKAKNIWDAKGVAEVLHIAVQDNGYGISPVDQKKIFTKFFRAEDNSIRESPGTGLGLNIFKQLIELSGGKAWFESELGKGSTFHFTVPVASAWKAKEQESVSPS